MKHEIFCGARVTMEKVMKRGVIGLNPKTHKWQVIDKSAKYKVSHIKGVLWGIFSDTDLIRVAKERGLIL